jgi:hypothetical protein
MSYNVYRTAYLGVPRDHHAIFVETAGDGTGYIFQVTGDIQNGMRYECKAGKKPENSASFLNKMFLGWVATTNWGRIGEICSSIPPSKTFLLRRSNSQGRRNYFQRSLCDDARTGQKRQSWL